MRINTTIRLMFIYGVHCIHKRWQENFIFKSLNQSHQNQIITNSKQINTRLMWNIQTELWCKGNRARKFQISSKNINHFQAQVTYRLLLWYDWLECTACLNENTIVEIQLKR